MLFQSGFWKTLKTFISSLPNNPVGLLRKWIDGVETLAGSGLRPGSGEHNDNADSNVALIWTHIPTILEDSQVIKNKRARARGVGATQKYYVTKWDIKREKKHGKRKKKHTIYEKIAARQRRENTVRKSRAKNVV